MLTIDVLRSRCDSLRGLADPSYALGPFDAAL